MLRSINNITYVDPYLVNHIKKDLLEKSYYDDIKNNLQSKTIWKITADITETLAHIFTGLSAILAFATGFYNIAILSFISGCFGTISLILLKFSSYSMKESKERTEQVNTLLDKLGITEIPDTTIDINNENNLTSNKSRKDSKELEII